LTALDVQDTSSDRMTAKRKTSAAPRGATTVSVNKDVSRLLDRIVAKLGKKLGFRIGKADVIRNLVVAEARRLNIKSRATGSKP
jgi:hypothetical protein